MPAPKVCFDRILPRDLLRPRETTRGPGGRVRAIAPKGKSWINGSTLRVRFMGGSAAEQATARTQAAWWSAVANIKFDFGTAPDAEIRITFDENDGAWSTVGRRAQRAVQPGQHEPGLSRRRDRGARVRARHRPGARALQPGRRHSMERAGRAQGPAAGPPNFWDAATTRHNVFFKYSMDQINGTEFDAESIMLYAFPAQWTLNGVARTPTTCCRSWTRNSSPVPRCIRRASPGLSAPTPLTVGAARLEASIGKPGEEDLYKFTADKNATYVIDTTGQTDVYMKLFGPNSPTALLDEDDDSGLGLNPRISAPLLAGDYYVQVRHYDRSSGTGKYSIGVKKR